MCVASLECPLKIFNSSFFTYNPLYWLYIGWLASNLWTIFLLPYPFIDYIRYSSKSRSHCTMIYVRSHFLRAMSNKMKKQSIVSMMSVHGTIYILMLRLSIRCVHTLVLWVDYLWLVLPRSQTLSLPSIRKGHDIYHLRFILEFLGTTPRLNQGIPLSLIKYSRY